MAADDEWDLTGYSNTGSSGAYTGNYVDPYANPDYSPGTKDLPYYSKYSLAPTTSWDQRLGAVGGALKDLTSGIKTPAAGADAGAARYPNLPNAPSPPGSAQIGRPSAPVSLQQLMQLLMQRRNAYLQASNPLSAKPVTEPLPAGSGGLLGI